MIKTHMNNMKKYLSLCIMLLCLCSTVMAQQEKVVVKGVVTDEAKAVSYTHLDVYKRQVSRR